MPNPKTAASKIKTGSTWGRHTIRMGSDTICFQGGRWFAILQPVIPTNVSIRLRSPVATGVIGFEVRSYILQHTSTKDSLMFVHPHLRLLHEQRYENNDEGRIKTSSCICPAPIFTRSKETTGERREEGRDDKTKCPGVDLRISWTASIFQAINDILSLLVGGKGTCLSQQRGPYIIHLNICLSSNEFLKSLQWPVVLFFEWSGTNQKGIRPRLTQKMHSSSA